MTKVIVAFGVVCLVYMGVVVGDTIIDAVEVDNHIERMSKSGEYKYEIRIKGGSVYANSYFIKGNIVWYKQYSTDSVYSMVPVSQTRCILPITN